MKDQAREILAHNIKLYREALGYSQMKLAEEADVSTSLIASFETGSKFPSSSSLVKISGALHIKIYQLFLPKDVDNQERSAYMEIGRLRQTLQSEVKELVDRSFIKHIKDNE